MTEPQHGVPHAATTSVAQSVAPEAPGAVPAHPALVAEPTVPGASPQYLGGRPLRRYGLWFTAASASFTMIWAGVGAVLLPNQVQDLEFSRLFTGADSAVDLQALTLLRADVVAGAATATAEQTRLLGLLAEFDASRAGSLALVGAIGVAVTMLVQPVVGVLSDRTRSRLGRRAPWMLFGALVGAAFLAGMRFAPSVAVLALLWTCAQVILNTASAPLNTTVADRVPEAKRGLVSSLGGLGLFGGGIVGGVAAGVLFPSLGLDLYLVLAAIVVAFVVLFVGRVQDRPSTDLEVPAHSWRSFFAGFLVPLRAADFRWVWLARVLLTFGYGVSTALSFFMLQSYVQPALSQAEATALTPVLTLAGAPFTLVAIVIAGRLSDKVGRRKPFVIAASALMAAGMVIPLLSPTVAGLIASGVVAGFAFGTYLPVDQALFVDVLPDRENAAGRDLGVAGLGSNLGQALGPVLAGQIVALTGGYRLVWVAAAVLVALAAAAVVPVRSAR
jgi:MFS family permease